MPSRNDLPPIQVLTGFELHHIVRKCHLLMGQSSRFPSRGPIKEGSPWSALVELVGPFFSTVDS